MALTQQEKNRGGILAHEIKNVVGTRLFKVTDPFGREKGWKLKGDDVTADFATLKAAITAIYKALVDKLKATGAEIAHAEHLLDEDEEDVVDPVTPMGAPADLNDPSVNAAGVPLLDDDPNDPNKMYGSRMVHARKGIWNTYARTKGGVTINGQRQPTPAAKQTRRAL